MAVINVAITVNGDVYSSTLNQMVGGETAKHSKMHIEHRPITVYKCTITFKHRYTIGTEIEEKTEEYNREQKNIRGVARVV